MRKRLFAIVLALTAAVGISGGTASGAVRSAQVDTITMDAEMPDDEVEVDLGWKTQQDKGRWIDKMGIGDDVNSLLLIINNLDTETDTVKTTKDITLTAQWEVNKYTVIFINDDGTILKEQEAIYGSKIEYM